MRTRAEQLAALHADQQFWQDLAAEVRPDRYGEPGPMGEWSFGDMAGHLVGWRNRTIARLEAAGFSVDYTEVRRADLSRPKSPDEPGLLALIAARLGRTRLIDNLEFDDA